MTIYDIDIPFDEAKKAIRGHIALNEYLVDERVIDMVVEKGYMELEEALLQHKQRPHMLTFLNTGWNGIGANVANRKKLGLDASIDDQFNRA
mmetsp:Transcript_14496/g.21369  ORF Transcript_14496/g.21369 Transcript_14496/m.21369 type:complete len:92 (+) Transcript_14496:237-512(+)